MFKRLFGPTTADQLVYLENRIWPSLAVIVLSFIASFFVNGALGIIALVILYWGWSGVKNWFGFAAFTTILAGYDNLMLGVLVGVFYLLVAYFAGVFIFLLGVVRYGMLKLQHTY